MGTPLVGDVVVLLFPQTDLQAGKRRPALVVADLTGDDLVLCQITSQSRRNDSSSIPLTSVFERDRLNVDSFIRTNRLFTVDHSVILYSAAKVNSSKLNEARAKIREHSVKPPLVKFQRLTIKSALIARSTGGPYTSKSSCQQERESNKLCRSTNMSAGSARPGWKFCKR
ncbi:MAG: type II toxin-antitoxin system PemK/MazF family toxin [Acidobacteriota bacterium]